MPVIVGIGASAGGLGALEEFFKNVPPDKGIAYVVIQHLEPAHKSMMPDLLQRLTQLNVVQAKNNQPVKPDTVYVIPPGYDMFLQEHAFLLRKQKSPRGVPLPVDHFFRSLSRHLEHRAIGIILSGSGSDGTLGLKEIKAANGIVMVQDPATAGHRGMPQSALNTGMVDYVLSPSEMPGKMLDFVETVLNHPESRSMQSRENIDQLEEIFKILENNTKHDFSDYKHTTIFRRIERRIAINAMNNIDDYVEKLRNDQSEVEALFRELLIGVTSFFRDNEAFRLLEKEAFPHLFENKKKIRVWVAGCSTGEEAYSIAILLDRYRERAKKKCEIQIFATDIDPVALEVARAGKYTANIEADVSWDLLNTYFVKTGEVYQIKKDLRKMVLFAEHSIVKDPPYSQLDLITCRNVLIYLLNKTQKKIFNVFHYALQNNGFLFLGNSESISSKTDTFKAIDSKWKIFRKVNTVADYADVWKSGEGLLPNTAMEQATGKAPVSIQDFINKIALNKYLPPLLVINNTGEVHYSTGKLGHYFQFPTGIPNYNLLAIAHDGLRIPLSNGLRKIRAGQEEVVMNNVRLINDDSSEILRISFIPIKKPPMLSNLHILLVEPYKYLSLKGSGEAVNRPDQDQADYINDLEQELVETKEYLQNVIEELETSNEELKSANEEAQSSNEELQSTNQELETSKEELQSLNEELETTNSELQRKVEELSRLNDDINNFLTGTQVGTIFLDKDLKIKRFTPFVKKIVDLLDTDIGRSFTTFTSKIQYPDLAEKAREVLETLIPKEAEVVQQNNRYYWMRILPYRTMQDSIEGLVITFIDITEQKKIQAEGFRHQEQYKLLFTNMTNGILVQEIIYDDSGKAVDAIAIDANPAYQQHTGYDPKDIVGNKMSEVFPNFNRQLFNKFAKVAETGQPYSTISYVPQFNKHLKITAYKFGDKKYVAIFDDVTVEIESGKKIRQSEEKFKNLFNNMAAGIAICRLTEDSNGKLSDSLTDVNLWMIKTFDLDREKIAGKKLIDVFPFFGTPFYQHVLETVQKGNVLHHESYLGGQDKYFEIKAFPLVSEFFAIVLQDITEVKKEIRAYNHLSSIVETSEDAIYSISLQAKILSWNKGAENLYGYSAGEIVGKNIEILSPVFSQVNHEELINQVVEGKKVINLEILQRKKNGEDVPVYLTKSPIYNKAGEIAAISDIVKDRSLTLAREKELLNMKREAEKAGKLKTAFLQNVSHEIRTPMNSILGFTDIVKKNIRDAKAAKYIFAIESSGKQLIRLLDDIMDISRIEADELVIDKTNFDLHKLLQQVKDQLVANKVVLAKEHIDIQLKIPDAGKRNFIHTDRYRLEQVLMNLLSNALKYTEKGKIRFGYSEKSNKLEFFVEDTGIGIEEKYLNQIFQRFNRTSNEDLKVIRGTGLGLAISRALVKLLDGDIWCRSEHKKGSVFYFTIPNTSAHHEVDESVDESTGEVEAPDLKGKRILIAEDDDFSLLMLEAILADTRAEIFKAQDGEAAIKLANQYTFDLVFLDIRLPKKDGYQILHYLRENGHSNPVIAQTAHALPEDRNRALENGFDEHIVKPLRVNTIYTILKRFLVK
ncbi:MAG: CheR family methyltransferase [Bacteroidales bacterium]